MFTSYSLTDQGAQTLCIGPDNNIWVVGYNTNETSPSPLWKVTTGGSVTEFTYTALGDELQVPHFSGICAGPDGNLWVCDNNGYIWKINTSGVVLATYTIITVGENPNGGSSTATGSPVQICVGSDNNLWFSDSNTSIASQLTSYVRKITTSGVYTDYTVTSTVSTQIGLFGICAGPDSNLWVVNDSLGNGGSVFKVTTGGVALAEYVLSGNYPATICVGPDSNLWIADSQTNAVYQVTTSGTVTPFTVFGASSLIDICNGPDGNLWVADVNQNDIYRISTTGSATGFSTGQTGQAFTGIITGPDDHIWVSDYEAEIWTFVNVPQALVPIPYSIYRTYSYSSVFYWSSYGGPAEAGFSISPSNGLTVNDVDGTTIRDGLLLPQALRVGAAFDRTAPSYAEINANLVQLDLTQPFTLVAWFNCMDPAAADPNTILSSAHYNDFTNCLPQQGWNLVYITAPGDGAPAIQFNMYNYLNGSQQGQDQFNIRPVLSNPIADQLFTNNDIQLVITYDPSLVGNSPIPNSISRCFNGWVDYFNINDTGVFLVNRPSSFDIAADISSTGKLVVGDRECHIAAPILGNTDASAYGFHGQIYYAAIFQGVMAYREAFQLFYNFEATTQNLPYRPILFAQGPVGPAPIITNILPPVATVGQVVLIYGNNFNGTTAVDFNGTSATFTVLSNNVIQATVPVGAIGGPVHVTTAYGTAQSPVNFFTIANLTGPVILHYS
jgi:sugar lactone lactonase YvrE